MIRDLRVCFVGDSFVLGVGDPRCLGWVGRLAARTCADGQPLTTYNLGVRRQTSDDILARWRAECLLRLRDGNDLRVVMSFGVNDTTEENGRPRVTPERSAATLTRMLDQAAGQGWRVLVVGPPPVDDDAQNVRLASLDDAFARTCREAGVPYVAVQSSLRKSAVWTREVRTGDGAHPGSAGYDEITALITPRWRAWLTVT
ncbi:G-D-S-L family lipolytic protein [Plantactinospora sp. BC1]|uniref:DUF459 domain-containing protein n=1 Tax=Plantactinospora sp. BC1 TaxID=2108470 RepID=UPI000D16411A|nr:GDSL-type esterase/lipase family protein [Plantactinospora sp. BC1]AVT28810.1 G-D-S-L family lipolytic protein [Plantactinospora sp. BC1]